IHYVIPYLPDLYERSASAHLLLYFPLLSLSLPQRRSRQTSPEGFPGFLPGIFPPSTDTRALRNQRYTLHSAGRKTAQRPPTPDPYWSFHGRWKNNRR